MHPEVTDCHYGTSRCLWPDEPGQTRCPDGSIQASSGFAQMDLDPAGVQARQDEPDVWPCPDEARSRMPGCSEGSKPDAQMPRQPGWSPSGFVSGLPGCFLLAQTSGHLGHLGIWPDLKYICRCFRFDPDSPDSPGSPGASGRDRCPDGQMAVASCPDIPSNGLL